MYKKVIVLLIISSLFFTVCKKTDNQQSQNVITNQNTCIVTMIEGKAYISTPDNTEKKAVSVGDSLTENTTIYTDAGSVIELKIGTGSCVRVRESSEVVISTLYKDANQQNTMFSLNMGTMIANPEKIEDGSTFEVDTHTVTAGVRGTQFIVSVSENHISKIAVFEGEVRVRQNIDFAQLDSVRQVNPELAEQIIASLSQDIVLAPNDKVEVSQEVVNEVQNIVNQELAELVIQIQELNNSIVELEAVLNNFKENNLTEIAARANSAVEKATVTPEEWTEELNVNEFVEMRESVEAASSSSSVSSEDVVSSSSESSISSSEVAAVVERTPQPTLVIEKVGSLGVRLSEEGTYITADSNNIIIASSDNKSVYCLDKTGTLKWKSENMNISNFQSVPLIYGANVFLTTTNEAIVMRLQNGAVVLTTPGLGTTYGTSPVVSGNAVYLPARSGVYKFTGSEYSLVARHTTSNFYYLSSIDNLLYIMETIDRNLMAMDTNSKEIVWKSDTLTGTCYTAAVKASEFLVTLDSTGNIYKYNLTQGSTSYETTKLRSGTYSNMVAAGNNIYYIDMLGNFSRVNVNDIATSIILSRVDSSPSADVYLAKRIVKSGSHYYYATDSNRIYHYNAQTGQSEFITVTGMASTESLVGAPAIFTDEIVTVDSRSNIYRRYTKLM